MMGQETGRGRGSRPRRRKGTPNPTPQVAGVRRGEGWGPQGFFQSLHGPWAGGANNRWRDFLGAEGPPFPPTSSLPMSFTPSWAHSLEGPPKSWSQPHTSLPITDTPKWGWPHAPHTDLMPSTHAHPSNHTALFLVTPTLTGPAPFYSWASSSLLQGTSTPPLPQHISCSELCEDWHPPLWPPTYALPGVVSLPRCSHTLRATYLSDLHLQRLTNPRQTCRICPPSVRTRAHAYTHPVPRRPLSAWPHTSSAQMVLLALPRRQGLTPRPPRHGHSQTYCRPTAC